MSNVRPAFARVVSHFPTVFSVICAGCGAAPTVDAMMANNDLTRQCVATYQVKDGDVHANDIIAASKCNAYMVLNYASIFANGFFLGPARLAIQTTRRFTGE